MGITSSDKELSTMRIHCKDSFQVKLSLMAAPDIETNPVRRVLSVMRGISKHALLRIILTIF